MHYAGYFFIRCSTSTKEDYTRLAELWRRTTPTSRTQYKSQGATRSLWISVGQRCNVCVMTTAIGPRDHKNDKRFYQMTQPRFAEKSRHVCMADARCRRSATNSLSSQERKFFSSCALIPILTASSFSPDVHFRTARFLYSA